MSSDILREMVSVIGRLRRETPDPDRLEELAGRLEEHLAELECLAMQAVPDAVEPAFEAAPPGPSRSVAASAHVAGPADEGMWAPVAEVNQVLPITLVGALRLLRARRLSPVDLVEQHLERIRQAGELKAFIAVFEEQARHEAEAADGALASDSPGLLAAMADDPLD